MSRKPRVLVLNHFAAPRGHAGGTRHVELFGRLEGWEHLIVASDRNLLTGEHVESGPGFLTVPVVGYSSNGWRRILNWVSYAWRATLVGLRQRNVDVVYASSPHLLAGLAGLIIATFKRAPMVLEIRDLWPRVLVDMGQLSESSPIYHALSALESLLYRQARTIVVMAEGTRTELLARGLPAEKLVYIPNAADPEDFIPSASREVLRDKYGFAQFTAIYAGAHGPANGLDLVLDAAEELRDEPIEFVLVGGGVSKAGLVESAHARGLTNVRFMDPVAKTEIPDLLAAADVGLHVLADVELFRTAVSPNKVFDYMAAGLPVLTNSPGIVGDIVETSGAGVCVTSQGLVGGVRGLTSDSLSTYGSAGREWIGSHQSRTAMCGRLKNALAELAIEGID